MKTTLHLDQTHRRNLRDERTARRSFPQIDHSYQSGTLQGACAAPAKFSRGSSFFRISNQYFAEEAPRNSLVDTGVFAALILSALLPIVNGVEAVAALIHTVGML